MNVNRPSPVKSYVLPLEQCEAELQQKYGNKYCGNTLQPRRTEKPKTDFAKALDAQKAAKQKAKDEQVNKLEQMLIVDVLNGASIAELIDRHSGKLMPRYLSKNVAKTMREYGFSNNDICNLFNFTSYSDLAKKLRQLGVYDERGETA